ncbi:heme/hemin ABC transporter substrate-binding protein [Vibrio hangzhouensis]|uniref:Iron complex transport system substrate-binding protein n=1 Tax=Vibrio hangzhouensis TaxID=462991 RepID=A0A1H5V4Q2_9VIBR|nr:hemin ABC transporter substrate-binding protein [Vibrio hangzhouensis]SEF81417.1 iron complex transport system substrate-binding protein [Vibrio hangzhouensis]
MNAIKRKIIAAGTLALSIVSHAFADNSQRIVSAGASVTELIYAFDAQSQLVGVDATSITPKNASIPKVGYHRALSAEGLLTLAPTLIVGSMEMGPQPTLEQLRRVGVTVEIVDTAPTIEGLKTRINQIAALTSSEEKVAKLNKQVDHQVAALTKNQPDPSKAKKVLFLLIHEGRPANVAGSNTTPNAIIELAGGVNPAASKINSYRPLSTEAMIEMQPDVILVSGRSYAKLGGTDAVLKALPALTATPAGINGNIVTIDGYALVGGLGLKSLAEAKRINALLYP